MPLVFNPLNESVLGGPPKKLLPKHAFIVRQLGEPSQFDVEMHRIIVELFKTRGVTAIDATSSVGAKDYLERILGLIRGTGFTVAIFSTETRPNSLANIALELGYAAMCGKPLIITQSKGAHGPSDLKRTDWIEYDPLKKPAFEEELVKALDEIDSYFYYESDLLDSTMKARNIDCAIGFERANKAFLLSGERRFIEAANTLMQKLSIANQSDGIADLDRLEQEIDTFISQARRAADLMETKPKKTKHRKRT